MKDRLDNCNKEIKSITEELKKKYLPIMEKCKTVSELRNKWQWMLEDIGIDSSDEIPGLFNIEIHFQMDRVRQLENADG